ncbi:MAG: GNAT N-acetyltransferase [Phycisphaerae bacterium]|nr:GNAT N-acetyltransferase [Phycisphaerae bacterium]
MLAALRTSRLILRAFTLDDAEATVRICGQRIVAATTLRIPHPYSLADARAWLGMLPDLAASDRGVVFAITLDGAVIGSIGLTVDRPHSRAEIGYVIDPSHWGKGYATEAARAVVEHAFGTLALRRLFAWHFSRNPASGRVLAKAGFTREGSQRRQFLKWGRFEDAEVFGMVRGPQQPGEPRHGDPLPAPPPGAPTSRPVAPSPPTRTTPTCTLRPLRPEDRAPALAAIDRAGILADALPWTGPLSSPAPANASERAAQDPLDLAALAEAHRRADEGLLLAIDNARGSLVGLAALRTSRAHERAEIACLPIPGLPDPTPLAAAGLIDIAFHDLGLKRLTASALSLDDAAPLLALGFRHETSLASHARIDGRFRDVLTFGLLRGEPLAPR